MLRGERLRLRHHVPADIQPIIGRAEVWRYLKADSCAPCSSECGNEQSGFDHPDLWLAQRPFARDHRCVGAILGTEFAADQLDVELDGRLAQVEVAGDFLIGVTCTQAGQHLSFARGQA